MAELEQLYMKRSKERLTIGRQHFEQLETRSLEPNVVLPRFVYILLQEWTR